MNKKRVNIVFLISIILYIVFANAASMFAPQLLESIVLDNFLVEALLLLPAVIMLLFSEEHIAGFLHFKRIKPGTLLTIIPFAYLTLPTVMLMNLLTQFVTTNQIAAAMEQAEIGEMNYFLLAGSVGIFAPLCEEVLCRGIYYRGYERAGGKKRAMLLSALLFALVHMNLNQAVYAFAMGIFAVLLVEATGSLWSAIIYHGLINTGEVTLMYLMLKVDSSAFSSAQAQLDGNTKVYAVAVYLVLAAITLPLAWAILVWMSGHEGRHGALVEVWRSGKMSPDREDGQKKDKLISVSLIIALILCILMMLSPYLLSLIN